MPQCSTEESLDKTNKKKRWWGDLFRRSSKSRKKPSDSSSEEEDNRRRGFLGRKRHSDRGSKDVTNSFLINPGLRDVPRGRSLDSVKSPEKSNKRRIKAKVEASRELLRDSSSDEASSYTSSLHSGGSFPRRSRAARTERHIRRLSRDLELQNVNVNKSKWSANVVYQECKEYDRKYRAKARSATPSPAQSPKVKRPAGRATSFDNIKSSPPAPPPRKLLDQRPLSLDTPIRVYHPPVYTAPPQSKLKARYQPEYVSEPWLAAALDQSPEDAKKPPAAPPRRQITSEEHRRQQSNLEEALNELEAIYKKLASEDGTDNQSEMADDKRPLEDDMAYRRLNKREPSSQDVREIMSQAGSYLLVSPTLSPPPITPHSPVANGDEPDIINDDVVYRTMQHTNNSLKISDPQPLFGIPLGPISPSPPSDYLHVEANPRFDYKPAKMPDVVRDDLAFRNLRKDATELKKKKAVRSLSANLTTFIRNNNNFNVHNNNLEGKSHSFQDIPEELRVAQNVCDLKKKKEMEEEDNRRYINELYASENDLLRELEEEARATSVQLDEELRQLSEQQTHEPSVEALYSRSMTDLLKELTKNLDYDFGFNDENPIVVANCQTCDIQDNSKTSSMNGNNLSANNNKRIGIAESRRKFFESQDFNKRIGRESFIDKAIPRTNRKVREFERDNPFLNFSRSPSNPESSYNEKFIDSNEYRSSKSPLRTISADSSISKENVQSFIERPFTRTSKSPILETSKSFNGSYSPRLTRSPIAMIPNGKPKSFSNDRDVLDKELGTEQYSRSKVIPSPVNFSAHSKGGKLYDDYCTKVNTDKTPEKTLFELRQRLRSPLTVTEFEKTSNTTLLDTSISGRGKSPVNGQDRADSEFVETYRKIYRNGGARKNIYNDDVLIRNGSSSKNSSLESTSKSVMTTSEDSGYYMGSRNDVDNPMSRSFDSSLMSLFRKSPDRRDELDDVYKSMECGGTAKNGDNPGLEEAVRNWSLDKKDCVPTSSSYCKKSSLTLENSDLAIEQKVQPSSTERTLHKELEKLPKDTIPLSPSIEATQKRRSFAISSDIHIDDNFTKGIEKLNTSRTPIDIDAIEKDLSSREPSPLQQQQQQQQQQGCCSSSSYLTRDECAGATGQAKLGHNDVTHAREDGSKQGEFQKSNK